jgi:IS5 family transposase
MDGLEATGTAERDAALAMTEKIPGLQRVTVAGDKGYDTRDFVAECRNLKVTPHVAQNERRRGGSAIDGRTTRHADYAVSQRKRIEECFGWMKTIGLLRKLRHRGLLKVDWVFIFTAAAYNLVRIRNLQPGRLMANTRTETGAWRESRRSNLVGRPMTFHFRLGGAIH